MLLSAIHGCFKLCCSVTFSNRFQYIHLYPSALPFPRSEQDTSLSLLNPYRSERPVRYSPRFAIQYSRLRFSFCLRISQFLTMPKLTITKMAMRYFRIAISGEPEVACHSIYIESQGAIGVLKALRLSFFQVNTRHSLGCFRGRIIRFRMFHLLFDLCPTQSATSELSKACHSSLKIRTFSRNLQFHRLIFLQDFLWL